MRAVVASALATVVRPTCLTPSPEVSPSRVAGRPAQPASDRVGRLRVGWWQSRPGKRARGVRRGRLEQERTHRFPGTNAGRQEVQRQIPTGTTRDPRTPVTRPNLVAGGYPHLPACGVRVLTVLPSPPRGENGEKRSTPRKTLGYSVIRLKAAAFSQSVSSSFEPPSSDSRAAPPRDGSGVPQEGELVVRAAVVVVERRALGGLTRAQLVLCDVDERHDRTIGLTVSSCRICRRGQRRNDYRSSYVRRDKANRMARHGLASGGGYANRPQTRPSTHTAGPEAIGFLQCSLRLRVERTGSQRGADAAR